MYTYFDLDLLAAWSISLSLCEAVLPSEDILFVDPVMKLSNDPVKLPLNASPLRPAEGENIGPASLANLRSALCTEYRLPDDTDRCKAWLSLREGWDTEKQKSKKMNELEISWLVYYYLSANFIFRKGWHTVKYINIKKFDTNISC